MSHRRSHSDSKSTHNLTEILPSSNKIPRIINEQTSRINTDGNQRYQQDTPLIPSDGHMFYCLYNTIQNLIHIHMIYVLLYHAVFWLSPNQTPENTGPYTINLEKTEYEQTYFVTLINDYNSVVGPPINAHLINKYIYCTLVGVCLFELIVAYLWTARTTLFISTFRYPKCRNVFSVVLVLSILFFYFLMLFWLYIHTFLTRYLTTTIGSLVFIHVIVLTILDKPYLFRSSSTDLFSIMNSTRKQQRPFVCSPSTTTLSSTINSINRSPFRPSLQVQSRKMNSFISSFIFSSRWSSVTEQNIYIHQCSSNYAESRKEADEIWSTVVRRMILVCYRTVSSFILFNIIPFVMIDADVRPVNLQQYHILIMIFILTTFLTHTVFLFPMELQFNLRHLATHLGHWRLQSSLRTDSINEWSSECNSYIRGSQIKCSSNHKEKYFIGEQLLSNAAHPQSISHSIFYRLFSNRMNFLSKQFLLCIILILCQLLWIIQGKFWYEIIISIAIIFSTSYIIFQIVRDRLIFEMMDDNEYNEIILKSKEKKSN